MSTKKVQESLAETMKRWQKIEDASLISTAKVMEKTSNPVVRLVMEIIQRDSAMHHRIQQMIIDTLEKNPVVLTPEELSNVWELVEDHIRLEKHTVELAEEALNVIKNKKMVVQEYLLEYLSIDERKHNEILARLETIKKGMYPYG